MAVLSERESDPPHKSPAGLCGRESITNVETTILDYSVGVLGSETRPSSYSRVKCQSQESFHVFQFALKQQSGSVDGPIMGNPRCEAPLSLFPDPTPASKQNRCLHNRRKAVHHFIFTTSTASICATGWTLVAMENLQLNLCSWLG